MKLIAVDSLQIPVDALFDTFNSDLAPFSIRPKKQPISPALSGGFPAPRRLASALRSSPNSSPLRERKRCDQTVQGAEERASPVSVAIFDEGASGVSQRPVRSFRLQYLHSFPVFDAGARYQLTASTILKIGLVLRWFLATEDRCLAVVWELARFVYAQVGA